MHFDDAMDDRDIPAFDLDRNRAGRRMSFHNRDTPATVPLALTLKTTTSPTVIGSQDKLVRNSRSPR